MNNADKSPKSPHKKTVNFSNLENESQYLLDFKKKKNLLEKNEILNNGIKNLLLRKKKSSIK